MRYRPLDADGDYTIGVPWLIDSPDAVAQAILTRLNLWAGQWFVDQTDGTRYRTAVLGSRAGRNPDAAIKQRILGTPGVTGIVSYSASYVGGNQRKLSIAASVQTQYSETPVDIATVLQSPASS